VTFVVHDLRTNGNSIFASLAAHQLALKRDDALKIF